MSRADFILTYNGKALDAHEMNVRDLAPAMLAVGELFEALNRLFNGKQADVSVNVRALSPGSFQIGFDIYQLLRDATAFLSGTEITAASNLLSIIGVGGGTGLLWLIRKLKGRTPERIEKLPKGVFRLTLEGESIEVPMQLLNAYSDIQVRKALEKIVAKPLEREGIDEVCFIEKDVVERVAKSDAASFRAPEPPSDILVEDERRVAYSIRDLSFEEDGQWKLYDGSNPIKAIIEDADFLSKVDANDIRFAKHDVLLCRVHFTQRRSRSGGVQNEYVVKEVVEHIPAPRQLRLPEIETPESNGNDQPI